MPEIVRVTLGSIVATPVPSTNLTGLSSRQVLFGSPLGGVAQSGLFEFDSTQNFLGIGTSAPARKLDVVGNAGISAGLQSSNTSVNALTVASSANVVGGLDVTAASSFHSQVLSTVGTTAAPGFAFIGDAVTGLMGESAGKMTQLAGGQKVQILTSALMTGFGSTNPRTIVDVVPSTNPTTFAGAQVQGAASTNVAGAVRVSTQTWALSTAATPNVAAAMVIQGQTIGQLTGGPGLTIADAAGLYIESAPTTGSSVAFTRNAAILIIPGAGGDTAAVGIRFRRSTGAQGDVLVLESTTPSNVTRIANDGSIIWASGGGVLTSVGVVQAFAGTSNANAGYGFQAEGSLGMRRDRAGFLSLGTSASPNVALFGSSGSTAQIGFFSTFTRSQASSFTVPSTAVFTTASRSIATTISTAQSSAAVGAVGMMFPTSVAMNSWQNAIIELQQVVSNIVRVLGVSNAPSGGQGFGLLK